MDWDEAAYDMREQTMIDMWNNKLDETTKMIREVWDKSDNEPKDEHITEGEWLIMSSHFVEITKEHFEGNYLDWPKDALKNTIR